MWVWGWMENVHVHTRLCVLYRESSSGGTYMIQEDITEAKLRHWGFFFLIGKSYYGKRSNTSQNNCYHLYLSEEHKLNGFSMKPCQDKVFEVEVLLSALHSTHRSVPLSPAERSFYFHCFLQGCVMDRIYKNWKAKFSPGPAQWNKNERGTLVNVTSHTLCPWVFQSQMPKAQMYCMEGRKKN